MCIGASANDTLGQDEQAFIDRAARRNFPTYDFALRSNDDGMTWAVLSPRDREPDLLRFTICRIDPCVMVMIEDGHGRRQFRALANIEEATDFLRDIAAEAALRQAASRVLH